MTEDMLEFAEAQENPKKRKRSKETANTSRKRVVSSPAEGSENEDMGVGSSSTAQQWKFDPENTQPLQPRSANAVGQPTPSSKKKPKPKAHKSEPEQRYSWLANLVDMDGNPIGHPEYDPRTVFIPRWAWNKFSPFETQYWEIKQKLCMHTFLRLLGMGTN